MSRTMRSQSSLMFLMAFGLAAAIIVARAAPAQSDTDTTPWEVPIPIVTGLPEASWPSMLRTSDGTEHAAWQSDGQIYHAARTTDQGWGAPRRIAAGISPVMVADSFGRLTSSSPTSSWATMRSMTSPLKAPNGRLPSTYPARPGFLLSLPPQPGRTAFCTPHGWTTRRAIGRSTCDMERQVLEQYLSPTRTVRHLRWPSPPTARSISPGRIECRM